MINTSALAAWSPKVLSIFRIVTGLLFIQHGAQKIFSFPAEARGPFDLMTQMGIGGVLELVGGALIIVGLFTRPTAFILSGMMAVAYWQFHAPQDIYPLNNGGELAIMYCFAFLYLIFAGPGPWSLDTLLRKRA